MDLQAFTQVEKAFVWGILLLVALYFFSTYTYGFWAKLGVPYRPPLPFFGNNFRVTFSITPRHQVISETYKYFKGLPFGGIYEFRKPILFLRDPQLIEHVMVKDFSTFMDRAAPLDLDANPLSAHLVNLTGNTWRDLRSKLAPTFTSGKLKMMLEQIVMCSDTFVKVMEKTVASGETTLELRDKMACLTTDVIGGCAFGLDFNALQDPNSEFRNIGKAMFAPSKAGNLRNTLRNNFPKLLTLLRWKGMAKMMENFFSKLVKDTIKNREDNNIQRNDFIQLMMEIRKQDAKKMNAGSNEVVLDDRLMTANAFVFLVAGFETTAATLSYLLYELALNPDVQEKLRNNILEVMKKHNNIITWETVNDMEYVDQVISETLRKHPPVASLRRIALKPYKIPNSNVELREGMEVTIPVYALHHDPQYFPNPERFDPGRFSQANKNDIVKGTYLPFGDGPRICIGLRFAKVEMKVALMKLIPKFNIRVCDRTVSPIQYSAQTVLLTPVNGIWLNLTQRT